MVLKLHHMKDGNQTVGDGHSVVSLSLFDLYCCACESQLLLETDYALTKKKKKFKIKLHHFKMSD